MHSLLRDVACLGLYSLFEHHLPDFILSKNIIKTFYSSLQQSRLSAGFFDLCIGATANNYSSISVVSLLFHLRRMTKAPRTAREKKNS